MKFVKIVKIIDIKDGNYICDSGEIITTNFNMEVGKSYKIGSKIDSIGFTYFYFIEIKGMVWRPIKSMKNGKCDYKNNK